MIRHDHIRYVRIILAIVGLLTIFLAPFVDLSWLKEIADSYAKDGDCAPCAILDNPAVILLPLGLSLLFIALFLRKMIKWKIPEDKYWILLILAILVGFLLRVDLAHKTLFWQDEAESAIDTINLFQTGQPRGTYNNLPISYGPVGKQVDDPFFKYAHVNPDGNIVHGWLTFAIAGPMLIFGKNSFLMRLPFCVLFIFSAILLYMLAIRLTEDAGIAALATLLYSTNFSLIRHEMQLRYYSVMIFISLLVMVVLLKDKTVRSKFLLSLVLVLAYHTHMTLFLSLIALVFYVHIQLVNEITDALLLSLGVLLLQSYIFNEYTHWLIHNFLPLLSRLDLIYLKLLYLPLFAVLIATKIYQRQVNKIITKLNVNKPVYMITLVLYGIIVFSIASLGPSFYTLISCSLLIFVYFWGSKINEEKYFLIYSLLFLSVIPFIIKSYLRNCIPSIPIIILIASCVIVRNIFRSHRFAMRYKMITVSILLVVFIGSGLRAYFIQDIDNNGYLADLIIELEKDKYQNSNVFVEFNHFPLLFYTDLNKVYYIWNINAEYFSTTTEKYYLILEPDRNRRQCLYYYKLFPSLVDECLTDPRFYLKYALGDSYVNMTLASGVRIIECN